MVFNSLTFLVFLGVVLALHRLPLSWRLRKFNLLIASYVFYAAWNPPFVALLWLSTLVDWFAAGAMARTTSIGRRRALLAASLATNLGLLAFFKYGEFLLGNFVTVASAVGIEFVPPALDIVLPVGISFYTFQTLSYTIDVYRGRLEPAESFLDFALYVTFFPQLVAGPIVRASMFLPQLRAPRVPSPAQVTWGLTLLVFGLFEKVVLADHFLAPTSDLVFANASRAGFLDGWIGALAFTGQVFYDFAGYSMCAIGVGMLLGFSIPDNFRFPYASMGFSDLWTRWHISLSSWLRDYLYIPLGGNRRGPGRTKLNLLVVMLLGGLWHGAAWTYVVWGGLHGVYLMAERWIVARLEPAPWHSRTVTKMGIALVTFALWCIALVVFRARTLGEGITLLGAMFAGGPDDLILGNGASASVAAIVGTLLVSHWLLRDSTLEDVAARVSWRLRAVVIGLALFMLLITPGTDRAFIYFQF